MLSKKRSFLASFVLISAFLTGVAKTTFAQEPETVMLCKALEPSETQEISESFKGRVEGKLDGLISKLAGGVAAVEGEYDKFVKDTLKDYPESQRLYVWQKLIYLSCLSGGATVDINELAKAYLVGPTGLDLNVKTRRSDIEIEFLGFDTVASSEVLNMHEFRGNPGVRFPDLIFAFTNVSKKEIQVYLDGCSLIDFKLPQSISINSFSINGSRNSSISTINGTIGLDAVGSNSVIVPPGQNKLKSYSIRTVDAPDRHERKSVCKFSITNGVILQPKDVEVASEGKYISQ